MSYLGTADGLAEMTPAHAGGAMGERDAAFALGRLGFQILIGPGGPGGHQLTAPGFDIVAFNPTTGQLWIVDNKASGGTGRAYDASAMTRNLAHNLAAAMRTIGGLHAFPHRGVVMSRLGTALRAVRSGRPLPANVSRVVTNAGGYLRGVGQRLARQGIRFEDVVGASTRAARAADIVRARARGIPTGRSTRLPAPARAATAPQVWRSMMTAPRVTMRPLWTGWTPRRR